MKQKINIMKHKPELSDEEIRSYMDFERLMASSKHVTGTNKLYWVLKRLIPVVVISGITSWFIFFANTDKVQPAPKAASHQESQPVQSTDEQKIHAVTEQEQVKENKVKQGTSASLKAPVKGEKNKQEQLPSVSALAEDVYIQAEPVDGYPSLYAYFNAHLVYPRESIKDSIQGVQTISFIINPEGRPEKIQVKQSLGEPFEKEAVRLIENMPLWKPATLNGKPVPSQMSLPLTFQIQKVNIKE